MTSSNYSLRPSYIPVPVPSVLNNFNTKSKAYHNYGKCQSPHQDVCNWALHLPDVQRASSLAHVCIETKPKYVRIKTNIKAIIQNGPTCGLTALNMLTGDTISINDILLAAKQKQFTNHGEMFCAKNLQQLAIFLFDSLNYPVTTELFSGKFDCDRIKTELRNGACILIAYDSDFNHAPCLKNGHKAHWAVIIGCLVDDKNQFHVFVRHGKTRNLALWSIKSLSDSNANLNEYKVPHRYDEYSFQMPIDGIAGENGLRHRCIILNGIQNINDFMHSNR